MHKVFFLLLTLVTFTCVDAKGQFTDRYWCFGDSAGIDFSNLSNPVPGHSVLRARGSCASICDSTGALLFYTASPDVHLWLTAGQYNYGYVLNKNHQLMQNGDSLASSAWYQEMIIVPDPGNINRFYVFTAGELNPPSGFFYSVIDLSYNGGLGKVTQKNVQLQTFEVSDCIAAVKHGNGRDWWVVFKSYSNTTPLDEFYFYLVNPLGVTGPFIQNFGSPVQYGGFLRLKFTKNGDKLYAMSSGNLFESYDFDRCNGLLSNVNTVHVANTSPPYKNYWSFAISPDASKLYTTSNYLGANQDTSYLTQYDLQAANVLASADTLATLRLPTDIGLLQTGPDGKIYMSCGDASNDCGIFYLYCDTTWNNINSNLSVINQPDSLGSSCDFQPFSFSLGGHRTYYGLPNNPNYELKADSGSACDTLHVGLGDLTGVSSALFVYYNSNWKKTFLNAKKLRGRTYTLSVFDISGREIFNESGFLDSEFYTRAIEMNEFGAGLYIVKFTTEKEQLLQKFVKN